MALKQPFQHQPSAIASYPYVDIASGLGFSTFYLGRGWDGSAGTYFLKDDLVYSAQPEVSKVGAGGVQTLTFNSSLFNSPRSIIGGKAYLNIGYDHLTAVNWIITATLKINTTAITSTISETITAAEGFGILSFEMALNPVNIKPGDYLSLVIVITTTLDAGKHVAIGTDPENRDGTYVTPSSEATITASKIKIPFRIDV